MADKQWRFLYAAATTVLILVLCWHYNAPVSLTNPQGRWLEILLLTVASAYLFEPFFLSGGQAVANTFLATVAAVDANFEGPRTWWWALTVAAVAAFSLLTIAYWIENDDSHSERHRVAATLRRVGVFIGSWRSLLLGTLVLTLSTYNPPFSPPWTITAIVIIVISAAIQFPPHQLVRELISGFRKPPSLRVADLSAPSELLLVGAGARELVLGQTIGLTGSGVVSQGVYIGPTFFEGQAAARVLVPALPTLTAENTISAIRVEEPSGEPPDLVEAIQNESGLNGVAITGTIGEGSTIDSLVLDLLPAEVLTIGQLLWVRRGDTRLFWQVADAEITRSNWAGQSRRLTSVSTNQVGVWREEQGSFADDVTTPRVNEVVFSGSLDLKHSPPPPTEVEVGKVPLSEFPVRVNLRELSLHHVAILGVTGTGKTHLTFALARALAKAGTKVICVDSTGQYSARFVPEGAPEIDLTTAKDFLNGDDPLGIYLPNATQSSVTEANKLAKGVFSWARARPKVQKSASAHALVIFEEAQNYVPEAFVVDDFKLKAQSQETSRVIMESRKFGLGFMLISQRTAMVTKSALSQCNTIFAFQAFDQTGLDYFEGICGSALAHGIPVLPHRHAVVMGRGLTSVRPIIVRVDDAELVVQ